jgi:hypothetical protein
MGVQKLYRKLCIGRE